MSDASPSGRLGFKRQGSTDPAEPAKASGLPERRVHPRVSGSNSYGDCRYCPSSWLLEEGVIPRHADRNYPARQGGTRPICQGTHETPAATMEG